jgi:Arc/MetJ family transcription regulator
MTCPSSCARFCDSGPQATGRPFASRASRCAVLNPTASQTSCIYHIDLVVSSVMKKKTLHIDENLLREARTASDAKTDTETVRLGLEALVRRAAYERLRALRGTEPHARDVPRRRERASAAKHSSA